jgi:hypothetical protein
VDTRYRVWIVRYQGQPPAAWHDIPPDAVAVEPAERGTMTIRRAARYLDAFNRAAQAGSQKIWAVAVPVALHYLGDLQPGATLTTRR